MYEQSICSYKVLIAKKNPNKISCSDFNKLCKYEYINRCKDTHVDIFIHTLID